MTALNAAPSAAIPGLQALRPQWPADARVCAAVTRRSGGVSGTPFESLNLAAHVGDDPVAVAENRRRLRAALALPSEPLWLSQVHGTVVMDADRLGDGGQTAPTADAAITRRANRVLAVLVADCLPVLFARRDGSAVGIAHAGWRGLAAGVLEATVRAFDGPAGELIAWLGPGIGPAHFEVGEEVRTAFCTGDSGAACAFQPNARGRWQCNLPGLARARLARLGVNSVHEAAICTYSAPELYSYRRDGQTGRVAALIWLEP